MLRNIEVSPASDPREETIADLVSRLVADGRAYARAELDLVKQIARHRTEKAKGGAIKLGAGVTLLLCALTAFVLACVLGLATLIGPFAAGLVVAAIFAGIGYLLLRSGLAGVSALGGDEEEKAALAHADTRR